MSTTQADMLKASAEKDVEYNKNNNPYTANGVNYHFDTDDLSTLKQAIATQSSGGTSGDGSSDSPISGLVYASDVDDNPLTD